MTRPRFSNPGAGGAARRARGHDGVSLHDVSSFDRRHRTPPGQRWWVILVVVAAYIVGMVTLIGVLVPVVKLGEEGEKQFFGWFAVVTAAYTGLLALLVWRGAARRVRIDRLALASGLGYSAREPLGLFAGTAARRAGNPVATDVVSSTSESGIEFSAATFQRSSGFPFRRVALVQLRLARVTPHIVLLNRRSRVLESSGSRFLQTQRLRLEGDFDRTFTLLCPAGYERDALYIFTPDVMTVMLDVAADCEIELLDGWIVAYTGRPLKLWRSSDFGALLTLVDVIGSKTRRQTMRYQDDRARLGRIAAGGRRLRSRPSAGAVISLAAPVALGIAGVFSLFTP